MATHCLFVLSDGTVERRAFDRELPSSYLVPISTGVIWHQHRRASDAKTSFPVEEFTRQGKTFDGLPIYCADGWTVKEAAQTARFSREEEHSDYFTQACNELSCNIIRFILAEHPQAVEIDRWRGDVPLTMAEIHEGLERTQIRTIGERILVAIPTAHTPSHA